MTGSSGSAESRGPGENGETAPGPDDAPAAAQFVLASASPQRRQLLAEAGFRFRVAPSDVDEEALRHLDPLEMAQRLAVLKATSVAARFAQEVVLAADTVVALGDQPLGKPADAADAARMLCSLSGSRHRVITGLAVVRLNPALHSVACEVSTVEMRALSASEIERYVASGAWEGKAGGYGLQDDDPFVTCITGSKSNIIGLPIETACRLLESGGVRSLRKGCSDKTASSRSDD